MLSISRSVARPANQTPHGRHPDARVQDAAIAESCAPAREARLPRSSYVSVGIEGTLEPVSGRDTLTASGHFSSGQWRRDLRLVGDLGLREVRYPIPWHHIEREPDRFVWGPLDRIVNAACWEHGLTLVADPLHHTSYPRWLHAGFLDPRFTAAYVRFVTAFARRYPEVRVFTPFNEPTCTLDFCGLRGFWHPYAADERAYVTMLRNTARATAEVIRQLRHMHRDVYILHVDTFQHNAAIDAESRQRAWFLNERRFLFEELVTGKVSSGHPLWDYLVCHGFGTSDLDWHLEHPQRLDERGGNYYPLNEEQLLRGATHRAPSADPLGFAGVVEHYARRLAYPLSLTETNIQGHVRDRISWLKYMLEQAERLQAEGITLRRFAWYPLFDCAGWGSLLQAPQWSRDPQGIYSCDADWQRMPTEFSRIYRAVAAGMPSSDIPAYALTARHEHTLRPLTRNLGWNWVPIARDGA